MKVKTLVKVLDNMEYEFHWFEEDSICHGGRRYDWANWDCIPSEILDMKVLSVDLYTDKQNFNAPYLSILCKA